MELFEQGKSKIKEDESLSKEEIVKKYRQVEKARMNLLKNERVGFGCPKSLDMQIERLR